MLTADDITNPESHSRQPPARIQPSPIASVGSVIDRVPPHDLEAELSAIGSVMADPETLWEVQRHVQADHFYSDQNRKVFETICRMAAGGNTALDAVTVSHELRRRWPDDTEWGGMSYLLRIMETVPHAAHAGYYAKIVREKALLRASIVEATDLLRAAYDGTKSAAEVIAQAESRIGTLVENQNRGGSETHDIMSVLMSALDEQNTNREHIPTGFMDLDSLTSGMARGHMIVVGARPSMGKTAFALCLALRVAQAGQRVLFYSLEQPLYELAERLLSIETKRPVAERLESTDQQVAWEMSQAQNALSGIPLRVQTERGVTVSRIGTTARREKRKHGLDVLVIDYLQLLEPEDVRAPREQQVSTMSRRLKSLALDLNVVIVVLAQLNRESEKNGGRPTIAHLRESGALEQDADQVWLLWREYKALMTRPDFDGVETDHMRAIKNEADVIVAKHRQGGTGHAKLLFRDNIFRFDNMAGPRHDSGF